jgi:hypothetical protein
MNNFFKNNNFYRSVLVTNHMTSRDDEIKNYNKVSPGKTDRFVDRGCPLSPLVPPLPVHLGPGINTGPHFQSSPHFISSLRRWNR